MDAINETRENSTPLSTDPPAAQSAEITPMVSSTESADDNRGDPKSRSQKFRQFQILDPKTGKVIPHPNLPRYAHEGDDDYLDRCVAYRDSLEKEEARLKKQEQEQCSGEEVIHIVEQLGQEHFEPEEGPINDDHIDTLIQCAKFDDDPQKFSDLPIDRVQLFAHPFFTSQGR